MSGCGLYTPDAAEFRKRLSAWRENMLEQAYRTAKREEKPRRKGLFSVEKADEAASLAAEEGRLFNDECPDEDFIF